MADLLKSGSAWLESARTEFAASPVALLRGTTPATTGVPATAGRSEFEVVDENSLLIKVQQRDYLILAADYRIGGVAVEPASGDRITDSGVVYEVMGIAGQQAWRWSDPYRVTYRVHAKKV